MHSKLQHLIASFVFMATAFSPSQVWAGMLYEDTWVIGTGLFTNLGSDSGSANPTFSSSINGSVTGQVQQFNVVGATLLSFRIIGIFEATSDGTIDENTPEGASPGGTLDTTVANDFVSLLGDVTGTGSGTDSGNCVYPNDCSASATGFFDYAVADLSTVLGFGTIDVIASANSLFEGGGDGDDSFFHSLGLELSLLRVELAYCTQETGDWDCAEAVVGQNSPDPALRQVPAPASIFLLGIGLLGLGWVRRKTI